MKLLFVYNADSNFFSLIKGTAHKLMSPETYPCNLCKLTYPFASMDKEWKTFVKSLPYQTEFLHRDEFVAKYPKQDDIRLPVILAEDNSGLRLLISAEEINRAKNIKELIETIRRIMPVTSGKRIYRCSECSLGYTDEKIAAACQAWCKKHKSCNLDIIKYAIKEHGKASSK